MDFGLKEWGGGAVCDENLFYKDNVEWSSKKLWKMVSADEKANKNNKK